MTYFEIKTMGGTKIVISEDELETVVKAIARGDRTIITRNGIFPAHSYDSIQVAKDRMSQINEFKKLGMAWEEPVSEFAKLLSGKMEMLSSAERTKAQEEAAREEREL